MSTDEKNEQSSKAPEARSGSGSELQPAPPMAWLLLPIALLALLAFLSRR
jgi:hypothetical protein